MKTIYELLRTTRTAQSKKNKAARVQKLIQRRRSRLVQFEQLESRNLMASSFGLVTSEGTWAGKDCDSTYPSGTCQTTSPVSIGTERADFRSPSQVTLLKAPDGGKVSSTEFPPYSVSNDFYPGNGLLTMESGQTNKSFGIQQEVEVADYFAAKVLQNPTDGDIVTYQTTVKVTTSGDYTFFWMVDAAPNKDSTSSLAIANKTVGLAQFDTQKELTVTLAAGTEYFVVIKLHRSGNINRKFGLDWSGPGVTRQLFIPSSDVLWKNEFPANQRRQPESGFISVGATIDARKRFADTDYGLRYTTTFTVPTTGSYNFFVTTIAPRQEILNYNDLASLKLGTEFVAVKERSAQTASGTRTLTAGAVVTMEVTYLHWDPSASIENNLKVEWSGPGFTRTEFKPTNPLKYNYYRGVFTDYVDPSILQLRDVRFLSAPFKSFTFYDPNSFVLDWNGQTTPPLPIGATADDVKQSLTSLSNVGAAGGSVSVIRSKDGRKYTVTFGGTITYKPALITGAGLDRVNTTPATTFALTKREEKPTLKVTSRSTEATKYPPVVGERQKSRVVADIPNGNKFPVSNGSLFTPTAIDGNSLRGNLETPFLAGVFEPATKPGDAGYYNVVKGVDGFKISIGSSIFSSQPYLLKAQTGSNGVARPISFLKIGGLDFEAPVATKVALERSPGASDSDSLVLYSKETSMLVTAPFEGGRLTLRLKGTGRMSDRIDGPFPIFSVSLATSKLTVTPDFELVSFEIGGIAIPASDGFKMSYDRANDKFTFNINNLTVGSPLPTSLGASFLQQFEMPGFTSSGSTYESAVYPNVAGTSESFQSIAEFENTPNKVTGNLRSDEALKPNPGLNLPTPDTSVGTRYKTSITVPLNGAYTFTPTYFGVGRMYSLKINNTVVAVAENYGDDPTITPINLLQGVVYSVEYTVVRQYGSAYGDNWIIARSPGIWSQYNLGSRILSVQSDATGSNRFYTSPKDDLVTGVRKVAFAIVDAQQALSAQQREKIKSQVQVAFQGNKLSVTGLPYVLNISSFFDLPNVFLPSNTPWQQKYGTVSSPVKFTLRSGTLTLNKGVLAPVSNIPVDSFSIGRTVVNEVDKQFQTTFEPLQPAPGGTFKLSYFTRNTYTKDGAVDVPGNSFGIYGSETQLPLEVAGVKLTGLANLGTDSAPGLVVTNGQFNRLRYSVPDVTVDGLVFKATDVGSAKPLSVNYLPPEGVNPKSYVVLGGAVLKAGGTIKSDMKANFGGLGSDGLRIYPANASTPASYTFSFGVADTFLAGTQAIQSAPGLNGLNLLYDQKAKAYYFRGNAFLDFNPTRPHTPTDLAFTGTQLAVSATVPDGVKNFPANRLDSNTLNFFFSKDSSINGFQFSPRSTSNPLRVTITNNNGIATDTVGGAFTMLLDGASLYGVMDSTSFTNATYPSAGYVLDFSPQPGLASGFSLAGVTMDNAKKATLTKTLSVKFPVARFDGNIIAQGSVGSEVAILEANAGKITKAEITSTGPRAIGDFRFLSFKATYSNPATIRTWSFVGPATYFGRQVNVGTPAAGNPQLKIGGDPKRGFQLQTISKPAEVITPLFELPTTIEIAGLNFDTALLPQDAPPIDEGALGRVFSLRSQNYGVKLGNTTLSLSVGAKIRVSPSGVSVESFSATGVQNSSFTIGSASLQIKTVTVEYNLTTKKLQLSGDARFTFKAQAVNVDMNVTLGTKEKPGLVIKDGSVESFQVSVTGSFELLKLSVTAEKLTVDYKKENQEFAIYGGIKLSTAAQAGVQVIKDLAVTLGTKENPGIKIVDGSLESLDISITGAINLFKITAAPEKLQIRYTASKNLLQITGSLRMTLAPNLELTAALPGEGLLIDTSTGTVQIRGLSLESSKEIKFGVMTIKGLKVEYSEDDAGEVSIAAAAEIQLPSGLAVGGSFKIINGKLDAIGISFEKNPGILVANGLVNIYRIEASVEGLTNLDNFKISGTVKATVGPLVKFGGESYALADVTGTINITPAYLELIGDVQLVGGKFGNGKFVGRLDWNPKPGSQSQSPQVSFEADVKLYPGDVVQGKIKAFADIRGNVDFTAEMGVFVPQPVPLVGGVSLGRLQVELRVRPAEEPSASYAKFGFSDIAVTAIRVPTFHGSVRIGFDKIVDYNFGARVYIPLFWPLPNIDYSFDVGGRFELRDATDNPFVEILAASSVSGTPNGEIVFSSMTPLPDDTFIDIYADNDNLGNDGLLIASSIPYRAGSQTFVWEDMAAFASPGEPVYVYAVINDGKHAKGYSDYSPRFNVAPGFVPTVAAPTVLHFAAGEAAAFSAATGNAIVIGDPRNPHDSDSEVEVILNVGGGTIDLSHAPTNIRYSGEGTSRMTLRGSATAITAALDGLHYAQRFATSDSDTLNITVTNLPLENINGGVKASVLLDPNPLRVSLLPSQNADAPNAITIGSDQETPLENVTISSLYSSYVTGAKVSIVGYEKGQDLLSLPLDDEYFSDVDGAFDFETGVLTLSGFEWTEDYEYALRNVVFTTRSATAGKSLAVSLVDDEGDKGQLVVPLSIVAGHTEPELFLNSTGLAYINGSGEIAVLPEGTIDVANGSTIQSVTISFIEGSYVASEDRLSYSGTSIIGSFDAENGVLTLTGQGTEEDWSSVLQQVKYTSTGSTFTEGNRYLNVTVTDNGVESNVASEVLVVDKALLAESHSSPVLTLTSNNLHLPANADFAYLDSGLTLTAGSPMILSATVAITGNYIAGEDELAITTTWDGMTSEFDPLTGVLTISGLATVFEYEDVLRSVVFIDSAAYRTPGPAEITYTVFDGLSSSEVELVTIEIASAPYIGSDLDSVLLYDGGQTADSISDTFHIQHSGQITGAIVSISGGFQTGEDDLVFAGGNGITGVYDAAIGVLTLSGDATTAQYEAALASVKYKNTRFNPSYGERVIDFQVIDADSVSNIRQSLVVVDADVMPPKVSLGAASSFTEDGLPVAIAPNFSLTSLDANVTFLSAQEVLFGAEISILNYREGEDTLTLIGASENIEGAFDPAEGRIYLTGEATFDEYEAAIRSIVYSNSSEVPTTEPRQISIRLLESGANGMNNQAVTTQLVFALPDPVTLVGGVAADISVLQNEESVSLGLEDLVFSSPEFTSSENELVFRAVSLPSDLLGTIVLSDGTELQPDSPYSIAQLQGLRFEPQLGSMGIADFTFAVSLSDLDSDNLDSGVFLETIKIVLDGVATSTPSQAYVAQVIRDSLGKNPDQATLDSLTSLLNQKLNRVGREENGFFDEAEARQSFVAEFTNSDKYRRETLNDFYKAIFNRTATTDELNTRLAELASGKTLDQIRFDLLASDDYFRNQSSSGVSGYVNAIYKQLLNREPSTAESDRWVSALGTSESRLSVVAEIGSWSSLSTSDREAIVVDLLHRDFELSDNTDFDFTSREFLTLSVLSSDEYFLSSSTPTNASRVQTHITTDYPSVGKLGDIAGDKAGGTLVAPQYVLVAAHSVVGIPPGQLSFTIGGNKYRIEDVFLHPDYDSDAVGTDFGNDIAILKLNQPVAGISPSVLSGKSPRLGDVLKLVGFGQEGGSAYGTKRVGSTPSVDDVGTTTFRWTHTSDAQNDSDPGDSGSPLFASVDGVEQVIGIVSGGTSSSSDVGDVATNTRVDKYLEWIRSVVPSVTVVDAVDPPSLIIDDTDLTIDENAGLHTIPFQMSADGAIALSIESSNANMFTDLRFDSDGTNEGRVLFQTAANIRGTVQILLTAKSGSLSKTETITVTVEERNDRPTIDPVPIQVVDANESQKTVALTGISSGIGEQGQVRLALLSAFPLNFFSASGINYVAGANSASLNFKTNSYATGRGTMMVEVRDPGSDGIYNTSDDAVTNQSVDVVLNNAPNLNSLGDLRILTTAGEQTIALTGIGSGETPPQLLSISATSSNTSVVESPSIVYDPAVNAAAGQLKFTPLTSGKTVITLTLRDSGNDGVAGSDDDRITTRSFNVDVVDSLHPWQNPANPVDVNGDDILGVDDVLVVINAINLNQEGTLPDRNTFTPPYYDVNGNGVLEPLDALIVINAINSQIAAGGEGEATELSIDAKSVDRLFEGANLDEGMESRNSLDRHFWSDEDWLGFPDSGLGKWKRRVGK